MHPNPIFSETDKQVLIKRARSNPFALIISVNDKNLPVVVHAPVLIDVRGDRVTLRFHLARNNPAAKAIVASGHAICVFTGPHAYISPDWYDAPNQVGTWNYLSVEAMGAASIMKPKALTKLLEDLSDTFEKSLSPKTMWSRARLDGQKFDAMLAAIIGFEISVKTLRGTTKLGQNKSPKLRANVRMHLGDDNPISKAMKALDNDD